MKHSPRRVVASRSLGEIAMGVLAGDPSPSDVALQRPHRIQPVDLVEARSKLRRCVRRPSRSDNVGRKNRFQRTELSILQQGWLTKLSRGGLPNWNRRWFILIGGSLYYSRSATPSSSDLHVFTELLEAQRVDLVPSTASLSNAFKIVGCLFS